jgi:hypothetical protein
MPANFVNDPKHWHDRAANSRPQSARRDVPPSRPDRPDGNDRLSKLFSGAARFVLRFSMLRMEPRGQVPRYVL